MARMPTLYFKAGEMHYCKNRGKTQCCFDKEKCEINWDAINDKVSDIEPVL